MAIGDSRRKKAMECGDYAHWIHIQIPISKTMQISCSVSVFADAVVEDVEVYGFLFNTSFVNRIIEIGLNYSNFSILFLVPHALHFPLLFFNFFLFVSNSFPTRFQFVSRGNFIFSCFCFEETQNNTLVRVLKASIEKELRIPFKNWLLELQTRANLVPK